MKNFLLFIFIFLNFSYGRAQDSNSYIFGTSSIPQILVHEPIQFDQIMPDNGSITYEVGTFTIAFSGIYQIAGTFHVTGAHDVNVEVNSSTIYESEGIVNIGLHLNVGDVITFVPLAATVNSSQILIQLITPDT